nr:MAG TPA: hypothetical protein [Caudoviricetes sp.]
MRKGCNRFDCSLFLIFQGFQPFLRGKNIFHFENKKRK